MLVKGSTQVSAWPAAVTETSRSAWAAQILKPLTSSPTPSVNTGA
jgi:hypothetical protein